MGGGPAAAANAAANAAAAAVHLACSSAAAAPRALQMAVIYGPLRTAGLMNAARHVFSGWGERVGPSLCLSGAGGTGSRTLRHKY